MSLDNNTSPKLRLKVFFNKYEETKLKKQNFKAVSHENYKFYNFYIIRYIHCIKSVHIRSYSGPHFPAFGLNTERYGVSFRIQLECGKKRTRITPNPDTFYAVIKMNILLNFGDFLERIYYN